MSHHLATLFDLAHEEEISSARSPRSRIAAWVLLARHLAARGQLDDLARASFMEGLLLARPNTWANRGKGSASKIVKEILKHPEAKGYPPEAVEAAVSRWFSAGRLVNEGKMLAVITPVLKGSPVEPSDVLYSSLMGLSVGGGDKTPLYYAVGKNPNFSVKKFLDGSIRDNSVVGLATNYLKNRATDVFRSQRRKNLREDRIDSGTPDKPGITRDIESRQFEDLSRQDRVKVVMKVLEDVGNSRFGPARDAINRVVKSKGTEQEQALWGLLMEDVRSGRPRKGQDLATILGISGGRVTQLRKSLVKKLLAELASNPAILNSALKNLDVENIAYGGRYAKVEGERISIDLDLDKQAASPSTLADFQRSTAELTRRIGEAYNEAVHLKGMMDQMEEVTPSLKKTYARAMKIMDLLRSAKKDAYQSEMELRRLR